MAKWKRERKEKRTRRPRIKERNMKGENKKMRGKMKGRMVTEEVNYEGKKGTLRRKEKGKKKKVGGRDGAEDCDGMMNYGRISEVIQHDVSKLPEPTSSPPSPS